MKYVSYLSIRVSDMSHATSVDPVVRQRLAEEIRDACIRVGFFYSKHYNHLVSQYPNHCQVKNHGISQQVPEHAIEASIPFFALPNEVKMKYDLHATDNFKGYNAFLSENTDPNGRGDLNEGFNFGWEVLEGDTENTPWHHEDGPMGGQNVWPEGGEDMKEFRKALLTY